MAVLGSYRRLLHNRALARLLAGEFVSSIGDWLYLVALLVVVYDRSGSAALVGLIGAARIVPYVMLSVPAGILADRLDRRLLLLSTDVARGTIMLAIAAVVATGGPLIVIVALALLAACFSTFFGPTMGSLLPSLATDETQLGPANSLWATLDNLAFVIGPAVAGVLIAAGGLTFAFALNAASFAVVAVVLWWLPTPARASVVGADPAEATPSAAGLHGASASPTLRSLIAPLSGLFVLEAVTLFVAGGVGVLTVLLAVDVLRAGDAGTGYLNAAIGVGGVLGAVGSGALVVGRRLISPLIGGALVMAVGLVGLGLTRDLALALVAIGLMAAGSLLMEVIETTLFQRAVPDEIRGRALGVFETVRMLALAGGSFLLPFAAGLWQPGPVLIGSGVATIAASLVGALLLGRSASEVSVAPAALEHVPHVAVFAGLPASRLETAMRAMRELPVAPGQVVIRQGESADRFYVIAAGRFQVTQRSAAGMERVLREMGPDEVFGEIGLLTGVKRTASVTAETDGLLLSLDGPEFLELVGSGPGLMSRLLDLHRGAPAGSG